eukprot:gnl/MRDRNA2_/MRDRNA2_92046_c0_seq1.p1 gnl/MRDRNA2_/MRDRNA2_92046_c0~~gnl/MRDRNA2_/MRDRNA2_92046_c0_seq1.p1  ORF type:complete len:359 (+),score=105.85 gnl/MRDRNA2_/MRDRNA2_92046_c0_seq1:85-1161(+)
MLRICGRSLRPSFVNATLRSEVAACAASFRWFSAPITASQVVALRDRTGASMGKCREALKAEDGDIEKAADWLRKKGVASIAKRVTESVEAILSLSVKPDGAAIIEVRAETDFVTGNELVQRLAAAVANTVSKKGAVDPLLETLDFGDDSEPLRGVEPGATVEAAVTALSTVVGEKLSLGRTVLLKPPAGGVVAGYVHPSAKAMPGNGKMAAVLALRGIPEPENAEECLGSLARKLARHVVAAQPRFLSPESVPADVLQRERDLFRAALVTQQQEKGGKPLDDDKLQKIIEGKMRKLFDDDALVCQELVTADSGAPVEPEQGKKAPAPETVAKHLEKEAASKGLTKIEIDSFQFVQLK